MNIKNASLASKVTADTIRYYERIGIVPPIKRDKNGVRNFDDEDVRWLIFSRHMRNAGMSIESIIEYIQLFQAGDETVEARLNLLNEQRALLAGRIDIMQSALEKLSFKIDNYQSHMVKAEKSLKPFNENLAEKVEVK